MFGERRKEMDNQRIALLTLVACLLMVTGCATIPTGNRTESQVKATRVRVVAVSTAIRVFELDCGRYPTEQEGLKALTENPGLKHWYGPYIRGENALVDQWDIPLRYSSPTGRDHSVFSAGPDKQFGTDDDIGAE